jgi:Rrf2 family protein
MLLSQTAEYAFRAMAALGGLAAGASISAAELAERTGIPPHYVSKVMRRLVLAGLVQAQKGHGGGFALARAPGAIRFQEVLAAVDAEPTPNRCAFGWGTCDQRHPCPLHPAWSRLMEQFRDWARVTTLADATLPEAVLAARQPSRRRPSRNRKGS